MQERPDAGDVKLPYGKAPDGRLIHISEVESGIKCGCICSSCEKQLVAKKGPLKTHHFSHHTKATNCKNAYETTLHLLAKQVIAEQKSVWMPEVIPEHNGKSYKLFSRKCFRPTSVVLELWMDGMRPDIVARDETTKSELLVEIFVTHRCGPAKIAQIRERQIATIEIDLSKVSRSASKHEMEIAILSAAPRAWIFNSKQATAEEELRAEAEREEKAAQAREKRRIARETAHLIAVIREARKKRIVQPSEDMKGQMADLSDAGLSEFVGVASADSGCFSVASNIWQTAVIHRFVMRESWTRHFSLREVREFLRASGFLLPEFSGRIDTEITESIRAFDPRFLSPWDAAHLYLVTLRSHHLIDYNDDGEGSAYRISEITSGAQSRVSAAKEHRRRVVSVRAKLDGLLSRLPNGASVDADQWMTCVHMGYTGSPLHVTHQSYSEYYQLIEHLSRLEKMLSAGLNVEENLLGLPMEEYLKARKEDRRRADDETQRLAAEQAQRAAESARRVALHRKNELAYEAISELGPEQGKLWLANPLSSLGGENVESRSGLSDKEFQAARSVLWREVAQQTRERRRRECVETIRNEAAAARGVEWTDLWMKQASRFLSGRKPIEVCVDERGLEECHNALKQIIRRHRHR